MKHLALAALLFAGSASAAPFLWADVSAETDLCVYTAGGRSTDIPVLVNPVGAPTGMSNRVCKIDLANSAVGTNNITLAAKSTLWGVTSSAVPFAFVRPGSTSPPAGLQLAP